MTLATPPSFDYSKHSCQIMAHTAPGNQGMDFFRAKQTATIIAPVFGKSEITMNRISCATPGHGLVDPHEIEDAFLLAFNLRDYSGDLWVDGKKIDYRVSRSGNFTIYDYRRTWGADMKSPFDGLGIHIPRSALKAYEEDLGGKRIDTLHAEPGRDVDDIVVKGLMKIKSARQKRWAEEHGKVPLLRIGFVIITWWSRENLQRYG